MEFYFPHLTNPGTGKTYAAAFAARELEHGRILFMVHREQIAKQAMASFRDVFVESKFIVLARDWKEKYTWDEKM